MSVSVRYYIFPDASEPLRLSQRLVDGLTNGRDSMPQYAGTRQRVMGVVLDNDAGKPQKIDRTYGTIWTFDEEGKITGGLREAVSHVFQSMSLGTEPDSTVVSLRPKLSRKKLDEDFRWEPTSEDVDRIARDIWARSAKDRLGEAKGTSPKRPSLTYDATRALEKVSQSFIDVLLQVEGLKEPALKGLAFEARRRVRDYREYAHLYEALAKMADAQLELQKRKKSGKGVWYAVIEVMHQREDYSETVRVIRERCESRKAAVVAARRLLADHAHLFAEDVSLETSVMTDLEWQMLDLADDLEAG